MSLCHCVSHLPCPLSPNQSVICLAPCHQTSQSFDLPSITMSLHHRATASLHHCVTASACHHVSQSFTLPPATKPVSHLTCPLPLCHHVTAPPCHRITASPCHHVSQHLPCPLPPNQSVICLAPCHQTSQSFALPPATKPVSHLTCPLPLHHCATASPHDCVTTSLC